MNREDGAGDGSADIREDKVWFSRRLLERLVPVRKAEGGFRARIDAALTTPPFPGLRFPPPPSGLGCSRSGASNEEKRNSLSLTAYYVPGPVPGALLQGSSPACGGHVCAGTGDGNGRMVPTVAGGRSEPSPSLQPLVAQGGQAPDLLAVGDSGWPPAFGPRPVPFLWCL